MENSEEIIYLVLIGSILMLSLSLVVIFFVATHRKKYLIQQNKLLRIENEREQSILKAIITAQEVERNRIAKNLHDSVGAELSMLKLNLSQYLFFMQDTELEKTKFKSELNNLDQTIETISSICKNLYPLTLQNFGILKTFDEVLKRIHDGGKIQTAFETNTSDVTLGTDQEDHLNLFRAFQEIVNNIIKHSQCSHLKVQFKSSETHIELEFIHNGKLFTNENVEIQMRQNRGIGLSSIQNRINLLKGTINYFCSSTNSHILIILPR